MIRELVVVLLLCTITASKIRFQAFGVKGTLMCGEAPTPGIRVRLWDNDMGELVDSAKQNSFTDFDGKFEFDDWTPYNEDVDPIIRIAHDCNDGVKPGQRLFKFRIPKSYVVQGKEADKEKYFNLGTINLEFKPFNEERYYKGDLGKRDIIRPYSRRRYRDRRANTVEKEVVMAEEAKDIPEAAESSEEDPCAAGLCSFSNDRKRRELQERSQAGDEIVTSKKRNCCIKESGQKVEELSEEKGEGCASEGACPLHLTKRKRDNRGRRATQGQNSVQEDSKSDEIVKSEDSETDSGCSDGACSIDLTRKRRESEIEVACEDCSLDAEKTKKNATSKFGGRDESPEDRNEPW